MRLARAAVSVAVTAAFAFVQTANPLRAYEAVE